MIRIIFLLLLTATTTVLEAPSGRGRLPEDPTKPIQVKAHKCAKGKVCLQLN